MTHYFYNHTFKNALTFSTFKQKLTCTLPYRTVIIAVEQKRG